jgi:hypothetical protein
MNNLFMILIFAIIIGALFILYSVNTEYSGWPDFMNKTPSESKMAEDFRETYPAHPELSDCANTSKRDFCIGDVAEISGDISLCHEISDPDIKKFCIGRISLNETLCMEVVDEGLREACLESISLKISWSGGV